MNFTLEDLHATRRGDSPNWVHNCQNGKIGRLGRPTRVGNIWSHALGLGLLSHWLLTVHRGDDHTDGAESSLRCKGGDHGSHQKLNNSGWARGANTKLNGVQPLVICYKNCPSWLGPLPHGDIAVLIWHTMAKTAQFGQNGPHS